MSYMRSRTFRPSNGFLLLVVALIGLVSIVSVIVHVIGAFLR